MAMTERNAYVYRKYLEYGLIDASGRHTQEGTCFDPWIYPDDLSTIDMKSCHVCASVHEKLKRDAYSRNQTTSRTLEVKMDHGAYCVWYDYYVDKMRQIARSVDCALQITRTSK